MTLRQDRMADEMRDILAICFQAGTMQDPRLQSVTVTAVKLSADLQVANVYFRVYPGADVTMAQHGLNAASGFLKKRLAENIKLRRVPTLKFYYDTSIEHGANIESLLRQI